MSWPLPLGVDELRHPLGGFTRGASTSRASAVTGVDLLVGLYVLPFTHEHVLEVDCSVHPVAPEFSMPRTRHYSPFKNPITSEALTLRWV